MLCKEFHLVSSYKLGIEYIQLACKPCSLNRIDIRRNLYSLKWKREGVKTKTSNNWNSVSPIALKGGEDSWEFCLEEFWPFSACVMLQIRFSNHQLIKISMIYLYIRSIFLVRSFRAKSWFSVKNVSGSVLGKFTVIMFKSKRLFSFKAKHLQH